MTTGAKQPNTPSGEPEARPTCRYNSPTVGQRSLETYGRERTGRQLLREEGRQRKRGEGKRGKTKPRAVRCAFT